MSHVSNLSFFRQSDRLNFKLRKTKIKSVLLIYFESKRI